jgi:hypothetical protein
VSESPGAWRNRIAVALLLVMVFAAGMVTDAGIHRYRSQRMRTMTNGERAPFGAERDRHFGEELGMDSVQRVRVDSIFAHRRVQVDSFWKGPGRSLREIMDSTREEVRAVLTPEQRARFDRRHMERRPPHPEEQGPPIPPR